MATRWGVAVNSKPMKQQKKKSRNVTIGLDLGDRRHRYCVLDDAGGIEEEGSVGNDRVALVGLSSRFPGALVVMEAGCHSPWVSRYLEAQGCRVLVANPPSLILFSLDGTAASVKMHDR